MSAPRNLHATILLALLSVPCLLLGCNQANQGEGSGAVQAKKTKQSPDKPITLKDQVIDGTHPVTCGCTLEKVGYCSEYVEIDGQYLELQLPESGGFGKMPFCGKEKLKMSIEGEVKGGKVIAKKAELQEG